MPNDTRTEKVSDSHHDIIDGRGPAAEKASCIMQDFVDSVRRDGQDNTRSCSRPESGQESNLQSKPAGAVRLNTSGEKPEAPESKHLPKLDLVDFSKPNVGGGQDQGKDQPKNQKFDTKSGSKHLTEQQEKDAQVRRGEGPYQVADRMLGRGAAYEEKMALANAMKAQYKQETDNKDPSLRGLNVGRSMINEGNFDKTLDQISDKSLLQSIRNKLNKSEPKQEGKPEGNPEGNPESKPQGNPEGKPEGKPQGKPEPADPEQVKKQVGPLGTPFEPVGKPQPDTSTIASVYGDPQSTSSGRRFDPKELTVAVKPELARQLGLKNGDVLRVSHNGKSVDVVYTDAGPFVKGRGLDLSTEAGRRIGITEEGVGIGRVTFQRIGREPGFLTAPRMKKC